MSCLLLVFGLLFGFCHRSSLSNRLNFYSLQTSDSLLNRNFFEGTTQDYLNRRWPSCSSYANKQNSCNPYSSVAPCKCCTIRQWRLVGSSTCPTEESFVDFSDTKFVWTLLPEKSNKIFYKRYVCCVESVSQTSENIAAQQSENVLSQQPDVPVSPPVPQNSVALVHQVPAAQGGGYDLPQAPPIVYLPHAVITNKHAANIAFNPGPHPQNESPPFQPPQQVISFHPQHDRRPSVVRVNPNTNPFLQY